MKIKDLQVVDGLRKIEVEFDKEGVITLPRQAVTTTNINHSDKVNYKTPFLEILIVSIDNLRAKESYDKEVKRVKSKLKNKRYKKFIITIKGIASRTIKVEDFKTICKFQKDVGFLKIRLFFKENLYKKIDELLKWVRENFKEGYEFVLDHNLNFMDFKRLYSLALEEEHKIIYFINRKPTKNNKEKFVFIQGKTNDKIIRWISSLNKKAEKGSLNPLFYYWLGYDMASFMTRTGTYQVPEYELQVIKDFKIIPAKECFNEKCVINPKNTLKQSINYYSTHKRDSIPCSAFSIVELNTNFEDFAKNMDKKKIELLIQEDIKNFNNISAIFS